MDRCLDYYSTPLRASTILSLFIFLLNRKLTRIDTPSVIAELIISVRGDTDGDGQVTILDATAIQRPFVPCGFIAQFPLASSGSNNFTAYYTASYMFCQGIFPECQKNRLEKRGRGFK